MDDAEFDRAAIGAVLDQAGLRGWSDVSLVEAARDGGLDLPRMRRRFPNRAAVVVRLGAWLDGAALSNLPSGTPRERLFDIVMNRFEALQQHRDGIRALLGAMRTDPGLTLLVGAGTLRSMKWLLEGADIPASGLSGTLRINGLLALWLYALRAWEQDDSADLSATMAAVDRGLDRAMQAERSLPGRRPDPPEFYPEPEPKPLIGDFPEDAPIIV